MLLSGMIAKAQLVSPFAISWLFYAVNDVESACNNASAKYSLPSDSRRVNQAESPSSKAMLTAKARDTANSREVKALEDFLFVFWENLRIPCTLVPLLEWYLQSCSCLVTESARNAPWVTVQY